MKLFASVLLGVVCFFSSFSFASCIDVTGDYDSGFVREGKGKLIWSFKQNGCDSISTGSYYLWGSTKTDEVLPAVNYVQLGKETLCEMGRCFVFTLTTKGFEYFWEGSIKVNQTFSCRYNRVEMELEGRNFVRTFFIQDGSTNCRNLGTYSIVLKPIAYN